MQYPRSDSNNPIENDNCEALAPFVMSLFDGEADEFEAKQARAHLLICQTCAHRWLDWNRSRDLLRSVEVPAPPPTLLWRVLMACRLAAFTSKAPVRKSASKSSTNYNGAPSDLSAQILARTTRSSTSFAGQTSTTKKARAFSMPALAVPAVAMWLLVLQRDTFIATLPPETSTLSESAPAEIENAPAPRPVRRSAPRSLTVAAPRTAPAKAPASLPVARPEAKPVVEPTVERESPAREVVWTRKESEPREEAEPRPTRFEPITVPVRALREVVPSRRAEEEEYPVAAPAVKAPAPAVVKVALATADDTVRRRTVKVVLRPATLSDDDSTPRLRTARWKRVPNTPHLAPISAPTPPQVMRVSLPTSAAPSPTPVRLLAENFESEDNRVEEMRSVVDDFRAALAPDSSATTDATEDLGSS